MIVYPKILTNVAINLLLWHFVGKFQSNLSFAPKENKPLTEINTMKFLTALLLGFTSAFLSVSASAQTVVTMNLISEEGIGKEIGKITVTESKFGLVFTPMLEGLPPGLHGFHVHENPSCEPKEKDGKIVAGLAAGGHLDPEGTNKHGEPWGEGHLGDLPPLFVDTNGISTYPVLAPRLKATDLLSRSIMIHAGGDNYADHPAPLGGGGGRLACGVVK